MRRHCAPFTLHVLAWDFDPGGWQISAPGEGWAVQVTTRASFLARHHDYEPLALPGAPRTHSEHVWTARWRFYLDLLVELGEPITAIDGDLMFFSSPEPVYAELAAARAACAVSPHGFAHASEGLPGVTYETHRQYGLYNAGWTYWADPAPLRLMADLCFEFCYAMFRTMPDGRVLLGEQGYLELVQERFGAHVVQHPGLNVAPWNIHGRRPRSYTPAGGPPLPASYVTVGDPPQPLIAYHYSQFVAGPGGRLAWPQYQITPWQDALIYEPYRRAIAEAAR
jgi:hypothetical protein